jgi:transcriptional regulator with GAF, ATPase, and Fis domain
VLEQGRSFDEAVEDFERNVLCHALEQTDWNQTSAARLLGMSFRAMRYRVKKYGLKAERRSQEPEPEETDATRQQN